MKNKPFRDYISIAALVPKGTSYIAIDKLWNRINNLLGRKLSYYEFKKFVYDMNVEEYGKGYIHNA